jgi:hypothetical protein
MTDLYRKRPLEVRAFQWNQQPREEWPEWARAPDVRIGEWKSAPGVDIEPHLAVHTLEGVEKATPGYWIVQGIRGEIYPVEDSIFAETYEAVGG